MVSSISHRALVRPAKKCFASLSFAGLVPGVTNLLNRYQNAAVAVAPAAKSSIDKAEDVILQFFILVPVFGLLFSPELYFANYSAATLTTAAGRQNENLGGGYLITGLINHLLIAFILFMVWRHWRGYLANFKYASLVWLQFAVFTSSFLWSPEPMISLQKSLHLLLFIMLAIHIVYRYSAFEFIGLITWLLTISGILCLFSLVLIPHYSHSVGMAGYDDAYRGLYVTKNYLGTMCVIGIACSGYALLINATSRSIAMTCFIASLLLLASSRSATSDITAGIALIFLTVIVCLRNNVGRVALLFVLLGGVLLLVAALTSVSSPLELLGRSSTLSGRTGIWAAVLPLIHAKPLLGYGLGFWQFNVPDKNNAWLQIGFTAPHAHNDFLDIWLQTGEYGLFFFFLNMLCGMAMAIWRIRNVQDGSVLCLLIMVNFLVDGLTEAITLTDDSRSAFILFCFQIYIWKLAFPPRILPKLSARRLKMAPPVAAASR